MDIRAHSQAEAADLMVEEMEGDREEESQTVDLQAQHWRAVRMRACCHYSELWTKMVRTVSSSRPCLQPFAWRLSAQPHFKPNTNNDTAGSGHLSESELSAALVNGDWTAFDPHTVTLMIRMFDTSRSGTISFAEFCGLWSFLASWRTLFDRFDADRSGIISVDEFAAALVAFGYRLSDSFVNFLFRAFDKGKKGSLSFDLFVQACISLKRMTDAFKRYDDDRDGFVTLSFEQFLEEVLRQR